MSVRVFAPAKINLTLQVGAPRADGFHPVQSVVVFADVGDWVEAAAGQRLSLREIVGPFAKDLTAREDNLVECAAHALCRATGSDLGAVLTLEKNLPVASGVGGGSSDAAATLKALKGLWSLNLEDDQLMRIAAGIGADVPACMRAQSAWMTGIGEVVVPLWVPTLHAVLVNPLRSLPTRAVFREFDRMHLGGAFAASAPPIWRTPAEAIAGAAAHGNDLATPARALMPEIATMERALCADARTLHAGLSGSGATMFALVENADIASSLASDVSSARPDWWVRATVLGPA